MLDAPLFPIGAKAVNQVQRLLYDVIQAMLMLYDSGPVFLFVYFCLSILLPMRSENGEATERGSAIERHYKIVLVLLSYCCSASYPD
jgi:hypothetical protein